ncbi:MAG: CTP synthase [Verrucomicrobia bacterium]|nr:CTP synthase [Verrucomicrobiota bacterium]
MTTPRIGIIGDFKPNNPTHLATNEALRHGFARHGMAAAIEWLPTDQPVDLNQFSGFWCSPGSPYASSDGALQMIHWARLERKPFIGTCAGFQHAVLEFARNVLGINDAMHAEYDLNASNLIVTPLTCSLVGKKLAIRLKPGSRAASFYRATEIVESYYCNFGLNPEYREPLESAGLVISGWDDTEVSPSADPRKAEARVLELPDHPFFLATLYVPQTASTPEHPHPLIAAFCESTLA